MLRVSKSAFHDHTRFFTGTRMVHMEASDRNPVSNFIRVHDRRGTWDCTQASDPSVAVVKSRSTSRQSAPRNSTLAALCAAVALPNTPAYRRCSRRAPQRTSSLVVVTLAWLPVSGPLETDYHGCSPGGSIAKGPVEPAFDGKPAAGSKAPPPTVSITDFSTSNPSTKVIEDTALGLTATSLLRDTTAL